MSPYVLISRSTIKGNTVILADQLIVKDSSLISSQSSGCQFSGTLPGTPSLFVSHSFNCGLNAGSYGGRGGIGTATVEADPNYLSDTLECIKNGFSRMTVYGNPILATSSGCTGSPFTILDKTGSSPGAIMIIATSVSLDTESQILSGYTGNQACPTSSGGSIALFAYDLQLSGNVTANGQPSNSADCGEGGGGRVSLYKMCWTVQPDPNAATTYNFANTLFSAKKGSRPPLPSQLASQPQYVAMIQGEDGSTSLLIIGVQSTPCLPGLAQLNCTSCLADEKKRTIFEYGCTKCDPTDAAEKKAWKATNQCSQYVCKEHRVQMVDKGWNPYCMTSYEIFSDLLIENIGFFFYTLLFLALLVAIATLERKFKVVSRFQSKRREKKNGAPVNLEFIGHQFVVFAFQGANLPSNQWYLELEVSKDFNLNFMLKEDYLNFTRVAKSNPGNQPDLQMEEEGQTALLARVQPRACARALGAPKGEEGCPEGDCQLCE